MAEDNEIILPTGGTLKIPESATPEQAQKYREAAAKALRDLEESKKKPETWAEKATEAVSAEPVV